MELGEDDQPWGLEFSLSELLKREEIALAFPLVHPVTFDGGLCGDGACRFFRDNVASWPLLPLGTHFIGQLLFPFGTSNAVHSLTLSLDWLTPQGCLTSLALPLTPCSFTWSRRKENRKEEWSVIKKPTIHVFQA